MVDNSAVILIGDDGDEEIHVRYTAGDTQPSLTGVVLETVLTGYTIKLLVERASGTNLEKTASIDDATASGGGSFTVTWDAGDIVVGDDQRCVLQLTDASGGVQSFTGIFLDVAEGIAVA